MGVPGDQLAYAPAYQAPTEKPAQSGDSSGKIQDSGDFDLFGKDGFSFWDLVDIINPLQHIPVISTIYRSLTGDEIDHGAKIAGGALFGGPLGAASSVIDVAVSHSTGKDLGEHAMAFLQNEENTPTPNSPSDPVEVAALQGFAAANNPTAGPVVQSQAREPQAPLALIAQESARENTLESARQSNPAGMTAIPIARDTFAERVAAYAPKQARPRNLTPRTAPDLGLLADISRPSNKPVPLTPKYSATEPDAGDKKPPANLNPTNTDTASQRARLAYEKAQLMSEEISDGWVYQAILQAMDKYQGGAIDGASLKDSGEDTELPMIH